MTGRKAKIREQHEVHGSHGQVERRGRVGRCGSLCESAGLPVKQAGSPACGFWHQEEKAHVHTKGPETGARPTGHPDGKDLL